MSHPTATDAPTSRQQLIGLIATVEKLVLRTESLTRTGQDIKDKLFDTLRTLNEEEAADSIFFAGSFGRTLLIFFHRCAGPHPQRTGRRRQYFLLVVFFGN
ncbi:hypothetical protein B0H19DRAFT_1240931 [Mycena capillaripes]|nr:hypothetical protein B0H19DRAFT_1240931 [Mycena capillaripes]